MRIPLFKKIDAEETMGAQKRRPFRDIPKDYPGRRYLEITENALSQSNPLSEQGAARLEEVAIHLHERLFHLLPKSWHLIRLEFVYLLENLVHGEFQQTALHPINGNLLTLDDTVLVDKTLQFLEFEGSNIRVASLKLADDQLISFPQIIKLLSYCPYLEKLEINFSASGLSVIREISFHFEDFLKALANLKHLRNLTILSSQLPKEKILQIYQTIPSFPELSNLKIHTSKSSPGSNKIKLEAREQKAITQIFSFCKKLTHLSISYNDEVILNCLPSFPFLSTLEIEIPVNSDTENIAAILPQTRIKTLILGRCNDKHLTLLAAAAATDSCCLIDLFITVFPTDLKNLVEIFIILQGILIQNLSKLDLTKESGSFDQELAKAGMSNKSVNGIIFKYWKGGGIYNNYKILPPFPIQSDEAKQQLDNSFKTSG